MSPHTPLSLSLFVSRWPVLARSATRAAALPSPKRRQHARAKCSLEVPMRKQTAALRARHQSNSIRMSSRRLSAMPERELTRRACRRPAPWSLTLLADPPIFPFSESTAFLRILDLSCPLALLQSWQRAPSTSRRRICRCTRSGTSCSPNPIAIIRGVSSATMHLRPSADAAACRNSLPKASSTSTGPCTRNGPKD